MVSYKLVEDKYEGKPILKVDLPEYEGRSVGKPFSFGIGKAKLILANIDTIKAFVKKHDTKKPELTDAEMQEAFAKFMLTYKAKK